MSLRRKFALVFVGFALLVTLAGGWLSWTHTSGSLERELEERLLWVAGSVVEADLLDADFLLANVRQPSDASHLAFTMHRARLVRLQRYVDEAYVFRADNRLLVSTIPPDELLIGTPLHWLDTYGPELALAWEAGEAITPEFVDDGRPYRFVFRRVQEHDAMLALLMTADYMRPLDQLRSRLFMGVVFSALLAGLLGVLLATNIVTPLERLSRAALRIQRGRWDQPVGEERGDELGRLSRAMERMRRGIIQRDEQLRLMLAQVAHEIRNPLGGLELFASAALETDDRTERLRLLERVRQEVDGLNAIINNFLSFARPLHSEPRLHDLRGPLTEAVEIVQAELHGPEEAGAGGGRVELLLPDQPLMARADPDQVKRAALNLLQNAAHAGERVRLAAWWRNGEVVVSVRDDGPGVPDELRDRIFHPFVTDKEQGAGLGLAIVQRMVESNGGRVALGSPEGPAGDPYPPFPGRGGAEFRAYFPGSDDLPPARGELVGVSGEQDRSPTEER